MTSPFVILMHDAIHANVQKLGFLLLDCDFHYCLVLIYDCFSFTYLKKSSAKGHFVLFINVINNCDKQLRLTFFDQIIVMVFFFLFFCFAVIQQPY